MKLDTDIDVTNKFQTNNLYRELNKHGYYADEDCIKLLYENNLNILRDQIDMIEVTKHNYMMLSKTLIGNCGYIIANCDDYELKQQSLQVLKDYQDFSNNNYVKYFCSFSLIGVFSFVIWKFIK